MRYFQSMTIGDDIVPESYLRTLVISPQSELAALIAEAESTGASLIVESGERAFRLDVRPLGHTPRSDRQDRGRPSSALDSAALYRAISEGPDIRQILRALAVDAELRQVAERLDASLRGQRPELFDRRGRLRATALRRLLAERMANRTSLSGDELRALEEEADAADRARSAGAPEALSTGGAACAQAL